MSVFLDDVILLVVVLQQRYLAYREKHEAHKSLNWTPPLTISGTQLSNITENSVETNG